MVIIAPLLKAYKVIFDDNKPVLAWLINDSLCESVKIEHIECGHFEIKWLIVYANTEEESLNIALKFVIEDFGYLLFPNF